MTRTICDRCGKVIDRREHVRTVTLFRPILRRYEDDSRSSTSCRHEPAPNDVVWQHDLCMECANEVEAFVETVADEKADAPADVGTDPGADTPETGDENA